MVNERVIYSIGYQLINFYIHNKLLFRYKN